MGFAANMIGDLIKKVQGQAGLGGNGDSPKYTYNADTQTYEQAGASNADGMKKGGMTASKRADGIASRGKTRGKIC